MDFLRTEAFQGTGQALWIVQQGLSPTWIAF